MYKRYSRLIFSAYLILFSTLLQADVIERSENVTNNSVISSIPYSVHFEKFQTNTLNLFDKLDLSAYSNSSLFVGYGLPDKKEQNCYYLDNANNANILRDFEEPIVLSDKTYSISRAKMSFTQCQSLVNTYAGYIYNPNSSSIDALVNKNFGDRDYWIGLSKIDCGSDWKNQYSITQEYNKISKDEYCSPSKLNIFHPTNSYSWETVDKNELNYCLMQIDSVDYLRPIKVCAPWWQIEQSYAITDSDTRTASLVPFYNIIVPKTFSVCTDQNISGLIDYEALYADKSNWVDTTCTSYYAMKGGGDSCMDDMYQDQCFVNECQGYVQDSCELKGTFESDVKNYEIGVIADSSGSFRQVKVKDNIKTYQYSCPPPRPSIAGCENYASVEVFPIDDCSVPADSCNLYFECLNQHKTNQSACDSIGAGCERKYGDEAFLNAETGQIDYILVHCEDGRKIRNYNVSQLSDTKSKCEKYNVVTSFETEEKSCSVDIPYILRIVNVGLTESDAYSFDENCIRLTNDEDVPENSYFLSFSASDNYKTKIAKITTIVPDFDTNTSATSEENLINVLQNGTYEIQTVDSNGSFSVQTVADLDNVFANVDALVIGNDDATQFLKTETNTSFEANASDANATGLVSYTYFTQEWWDRRVFPFDDGDLESITRPYSSFARCVGIDADPNRSSFGTPFPNYRDGYPVQGASVLREDYESVNYKETPTDSDVALYGQYCVRDDNAGFVDWYGSNVTDLYYNSYTCSRLYGSNGSVWASPYSKRMTYSNSSFIVDSTATEHFYDATDYYEEFTSASRSVEYYSYTCPSGYTGPSGIRNLLLSDPDTSVENYFDSPYNSSSSTCSKTVETLDENGTVISSLTYTVDATVSSHTTTYNDYYYATRSQTVKIPYYSFDCPSGYSAYDPGVLTFSASDPDTSIDSQTQLLFLQPNSPSDMPSDNCRFLNNDYTAFVNLSQVKKDPVTGYYCNRVSDVVKVDEENYYADYECSKYYGSDGTWDYQFTKYYLYKSSTFKYFRQEDCGSGSFNDNEVNKDGSNAMMYRTGLSSSEFVGTRYPSLGLFPAQDRSYSPVDDKLFLSETTSTKLHNVIDKHLLSMDIFEVFKKDDNIRLISVDPMSDSDCDKYFEDLDKGIFIVSKSKSHDKCIIDFSYFSQITPPSYTPFVATVNLKNGSFNFDTLGYDTILSVESYVDGDFGYRSNHFSHPFKDAQIKIGGSEIFPINSIEQDLLTDGRLQFDRNIFQKTMISRNGILSDLAGFGVSTVAGAAGATGAAGTAVSSVLSPFVFASAFVGSMAVVYVINLFGGKVLSGAIERYETLYVDTSKYPVVPNVYDNDSRILGEDGNLYYLITDYKSGGKREADAKAAAVDYAAARKDEIVHRIGVDENSYDSVLKPDDMGYTIGNPDLRWYQNGPKTNTGTSFNSDEVIKKYNIVYYGATNSVSLFVPYKADYEIMAMDKKGNILGKRVIYSQNYISRNGYQAYQNVSFSLDPNFNIAEGIKDGTITDACRNSAVVEWGGGVSGAYYTFGTNEGFKCSKSNDLYVQEHSATHLAIRKLGSEKFNIIKLEHPLPFANRVFVVTMKKLQERKYACYSDAICEVK